MAGLSVGIPMVIGWLTNNFEAGKLASLAGLSILYMQSDKLVERMVILMTCCFGITLSYAVGLLFSFNYFLAPVALGALSFGIHYSLHHLQLTRPPGNFFFIMIASTAICTPFDPESIPMKIGYVALGTILTSFIALIYSLITLKKKADSSTFTTNKDVETNIVESIVFGIFIALSLAVAFALQIENPYWVPISCLAVMQGSNSKHTWIRGTQRIIGTFIGLVLTWSIAYIHPTPLFMVIGIIILQIIVEFLIVRNYTVAVIFITILTIFLAESGNQLSQNANAVFFARLVDILIGSAIGIIGGWILYHEKVHFYTKRQLIRLSKKEQLVD